MTYELYDPYTQILRYFAWNYIVEGFAIIANLLAFFIMYSNGDYLFWLLVNYESECKRC